MHASKVGPLMSESLSSTVKAGRLIRMFGWVNLIFTIGIGAAVVIYSVGQNQSILEWDWIVFAPAILVSLVYLLVGAGVKNYKTWAKILGAVLAAVCLLYVPIGTLIGISILVYLARGWKEPTPEFAPIPT